MKGQHHFKKIRIKYIFFNNSVILVKYYYLILSPFSAVLFLGVFYLVPHICLTIIYPVLYSKAMWTLILCFLRDFPIEEGNGSKAKVWNWGFIFWLLKSSWNDFSHLSDLLISFLLCPGSLASPSLSTWKAVG